MDAIQQWEHHGLFIDKLTDEEMAGYGRWTIGNKFLPTYPGCTERLFVKSPWIARPPKYLPGQYPFKNRQETGEWEYVIVLDGRLDLLVEDDNREARRLPLEAGEDIDVSPSPLRAWELPDGHVFAMGIAVFHRMLREPIRPGSGAGYEFRLWDSKTLERLDGPLTLPSWKVQYVDVLKGNLACVTNGLLPRPVSMQSGCHLFARPGVVRSWYSQSASTGVVIYLQ